MELPYKASARVHVVAEWFTHSPYEILMLQRQAREIDDHSHGTYVNGAMQPSTGLGRRLSTRPTLKSPVPEMQPSRITSKAYMNSQGVPQIERRPLMMHWREDSFSRLLSESSFGLNTDATDPTPASLPIQPILGHCLSKNHCYVWLQAVWQSLPAFECPGLNTKRS